MKHLSVLFCVTLFAVTAPVQTVRADTSVSIDFFFDALDPYGDWIYTPNYGYVWQPVLAQQYNDWSPYSDGYWAYTDAGWTWISNEDFGWATYHYGRWIRMYGRWVWVPGYEWAPAWVSWRQTDDFIGWAPLPPEARWFVNIGFNWWTDSYYDIGPACYSFVPVRSFATRSSLLPFILDRRRNVTYIDRSVNITNISYRQNVVGGVFVGGPDPSRIERFGGSPIRRLTLRRDDDAFRREWLANRDGRPRGFGSLSHIERDQLIVAAPSVRRENTPGLPPRVRESYDRPDIDRGWRGLGDANAAERLRARHHEELARARDQKMPEKTPVIVTGKAPPPAVGRFLKQEERRDFVQRPDPRHWDEEVRKAMPPKAEMPRKAQDQPPQLTVPRSEELPGRGTPSIPGRPFAPRGESERRPELPGRPKAMVPPNPSKVAPAAPPQAPVIKPDFPGHDGGRLLPRIAPMPSPQGDSRTRPSPMPRPEFPRTTPPSMPRTEPPGRSIPEKRPEPSRAQPLSAPVPAASSSGIPSGPSPQKEPHRRRP